jgi:hypothetical protein
MARQKTLSKTSIDQLLRPMQRQTPQEIRAKLQAMAMEWGAPVQKLKRSPDGRSWIAA